MMDNDFRGKVRTAQVASELLYDVEDVREYFAEDNVIAKALEALRNFVGQGPKTPKDVILIPTDEGQRAFVTGVGLFRLIQDQRGKKAEAARETIAELAFKFAEEQLNPEIAIDRAVTNFRALGRTDSWIRTRMQSVTTRRQFTDALQECGAQKQDYAVLTDTLHVKAFGITTQQHKNIKSLAKQNLRDHMSEIELTITTLGEQVASHKIGESPEKTMPVATRAVDAGGTLAGKVRIQVEEAIGEDVVSPNNFISDQQGLSPSG